eukprot:g5859.t1
MVGPTNYAQKPWAVWSGDHDGAQSPLSLGTTVSLRAVSLSDNHSHLRPEVRSSPGFKLLPLCSHVEREV